MENRSQLEALWMIFILSMYFSEDVDGFETKELPEQLATDIRKLNLYYGTLAWIIIFKESRPDEVFSMINSLNEQYPMNIEGQILKITAFLEIKDHDSALLQAEKTFICDLSFHSKRFLVVLSVLYSKCILLAGHLPAACRLLIITYLNHYDHPQVLNLLGRTLAKSSNKNLVTCAIGIIQECKRIFGPSQKLIDLESHLMKKRGYYLESIILRNEGSLKKCFGDPKLKNDALLSGLQWKYIYEDPATKNKERVLCFES